MEKPDWTKPRDLKNLKFGLKVIILLSKGFSDWANSKRWELPEIQHLGSIERNIQRKNHLPDFKEPYH